MSTTKRHRREFRKARTALRVARRSTDQLARVQAGEKFEKAIRALGYYFDVATKTWRRIG